jgi:hypothetical protein
LATGAGYVSIAFMVMLYSNELVFRLCVLNFKKKNKKKIT